MTRQELLSLEHLAIAEVTKFVHIHTEEGWYMTEWHEGQDIKEYSGSVCYYMPIRDTYVDYRVITAAEHTELERLQEEAYKEEENNAIANEQ
jgi:hypothetical protein